MPPHMIDSSVLALSLFLGFKKEWGCWLLEVTVHKDYNFKSSSLDLPKCEWTPGSLAPLRFKLIPYFNILCRQTLGTLEISRFYKMYKVGTLEMAGPPCWLVLEGTMQLL